MSRKTLMQALISEGVVQEVIAAAFIKAELHDMEMRVQASVYRALESAVHTDNVFEDRNVARVRKVQVHL